MRYLLCLACYRAWYAEVEPCACGEADPVVCSPWSSADVRTWYVARVRPRAVSIYETLATGQAFKRRSLAKRIRARGNTITHARLVLR